MVSEQAASRAPPEGGFERGIGLPSAVAINMTQMCGIGPFVTIPLMITALGGPQAVFGWIVGALLALVDGLVWAEPAAAMPGAGAHTCTCGRHSSIAQAG
jgi:fructoselysine transporter